MRAKHLVYLLFLTFLISCIDTEKTLLQPAASGAPGDVLIVMSSNLWDGPTGDTVRGLLTSPYDGLPQDEPSYDLMQINHGGFGKTYKSQRNIVVTKIGSDQPEAKILVHKNLWAKSQIVITVLAPDESAFADLIATDGEKILILLDNKERNSLMKTYKSNRDDKIRNKLIEKYSIALNVPKGYKLDVEKKDFLWLSHEYRDIIQGVLVYSYDYTEEETFTRDYLIQQRNKYLKKYVPGEVEGSYITTESLYPPIFTEYQLGEGKYTAEIRGLWKMQDGLAMGGPFISISQLDQAHNKVITVEGFVFAPAHKKRDLLRQVEAIILSLEITEKNVTSN